MKRNNIRTFLSLTLGGAVALGIAGSTFAAELPDHTALNPFDAETNVKIAWVPNTGSAANAQAWEKGIREVLEPLNNIYGTIDFEVFDPNGDNEQQISILNDLVTQEYNGLIIQAVDQTGVVPAVEECKDAGMTVVSINMGPNTGHAARVALGGYQNGYTEGKAAAEALGNKGKVCVIDCPPEVTQAVGDCPWVGFQDAIQDAGLEIIDSQAGDFTSENANEIAREFLTKYDDIDMIYGANDTMAEGAALAVEAAGRSGIAIWGSDGETQALEYIEQGKMTGTLYSNPYDMGRIAAYYCLLGIESPVDLNAQNGDDEPISVLVPNTVVTADNVKDITERW